MNSADPALIERRDLPMRPSWLAPHAGPRRGFDRIDNGLITGAAAVIAGQMLAYPRPIGLGFLLQQVLCGDKHSRRAKAALQSVAIAKGGLQVGDLAAVGQSFNGYDRCAVRLHRQHQAGTNDLAVHAHRARPANPMLATDMCSSQLQMLAQEVRQVETRQNMRIDGFTVDFERDWHRSRHTGPPPVRSGRPRSADAQRASNIFARYRRIEADAC